MEGVIALGPGSVEASVAAVLAFVAVAAFTAGAWYARKRWLS